MPLTLHNLTPGTLQIEGDLTVQHAQVLKEGLLQGLQKSPNLFLDLSRVTSVDLTGLQTLFSAWSYAASQKRALKLVGDLPEILPEAVKKLGFDHRTWLSFGADWVDR